MGQHQSMCAKAHGKAKYVARVDVAGILATFCKNTGGDTIVVAVYILHNDIFTRIETKCARVLPEVMKEVMHHERFMGCHLA